MLRPMASAHVLQDLKLLSPANDSPKTLEETLGEVPRTATMSELDHYLSACAMMPQLSHSDYEQVASRAGNQQSYMRAVLLQLHSVRQGDHDRALREIQLKQSSSNSQEREQALHSLEELGSSSYLDQRTFFEVTTLDTTSPICSKGGYELVARSRIAKAQSEQVPVAELYADLNQFKDVNDIHGHAYGDHVLQKVGYGLQTTVRTTDVVGRLGGDEFAVLLYNPTLESVNNTVIRIREMVHDLEVPVEGFGVSVGMRFMSPHEMQDQTPHQIHATLRQEADNTMYAMKKASRSDAVVAMR